MNIELIALDVDGTLTDGGIILDSNGGEIKRFCAKDGQILRVLEKLGVKTAIITGRASEPVKRRADDLRITDIFQDVSDKTAVLSECLSRHGILPGNTAYVGDDLNDYAAMAMCGFKACPSDAAREIRGICDYVSPYPGGRGAVRDICEYILRECGKWDDVLRLFGVI